MISIPGWLIFLVIFPWSSIAQAPQSFAYQVIIRGSDGNPLPDQLVSIRITLHQGSDTGPEVYCEAHSVTTNPFGLVNIGIGQGTVISGNFPDIY